jgi:hypothetical protein
MELFRNSGTPVCTVELRSELQLSESQIIRIGFRGTKIKHTCTVDCKKPPPVALGW